MLFLHILPFLLTPIGALPKHKNKHDKDKFDDHRVRWDIIPVDMVDCWRSPFNHEPEPVNWTAIGEASHKLKEWGNYHQIGAGDFHGFDVGK